MQDWCHRADLIRLNKRDLLDFKTFPDPQQSGQGLPPKPQQKSQEPAVAGPAARAHEAAKRSGKHDPAHTGTMDGSMYKEQLLDGVQSATLPPDTEMMCIAAYSDGTVVSSSGGKWGELVVAWGELWLMLRFALSSRVGEDLMRCVRAACK